MKTLSDVGKVRMKAYALLYAVNIVSLALSARVNQFMDFFFVADLFPFILSIMTLIVLTSMILCDVFIRDSFVSRPPFQIGLSGVLTVLWLAFNAFSTSRWRFVPMVCNDIPAQFAAERSWCRELQALRAFVWIEWVILFLTTFFTVRFVIREHLHGNKQVWSTALSRYVASADGGMHRRSSSFFTSKGDTRGFMMMNEGR